MTVDVLTAFGLVAILTGASALAFMKSRASVQNRGWLERIERQRRRDQFPGDEL